MFGVQVHVVLHAQVMHGGEHGSGEVARTGLVHDQLLGEAGAQEQGVLLLVQIEEFFPGLAGARIGGGQTELLVAVLLHLALTESHFESGTEVHVAATGGVGVAVGHTGFGAAGHGVVQSFFEGAALRSVQRHNFFVVAELGEAGAVLDGFGHVVQEFVGRQSVHAGSEVGVVEGELTLGAEEQVREFVGGVNAVAGLAADSHGFPVRVAFVEGAALGGDEHVDEFSHADEHAFEEFHGGFFGDQASFHVLLVVGVEVLVHTAVGHGGTGLLLDTGEHLGEPLGLHGFLEGVGGVSGHLVGDFSHLFELGLADGIGAGSGSFLGGVGVAAGPEDDSVADEDDSVEEGTLFNVVEGAVDIEGVDHFESFALDVEEAALDDLFEVRHPLDGGAEGRGFVHHEAGDEAAVVNVGELVDPFGEGVVQIFMVGLALPVGGDFFHNDLGVFGSDLSGGLLTGGQVAHSDVKEVAVEFGVQDAVTAVLSGSAAEEELTVLNDDGDVLGDVHEGLGPAEHEGLAFGFLHGLGEVQSALNVDVRSLTIELGDQFHHAAVRVIVHVLLALLTVEDTLFLRAMAFTGFGVEHFNCAHGSFSFKRLICIVP